MKKLMPILAAETNYPTGPRFRQGKGIAFVFLIPVP
jgi:hypothetical protein